MQDKFTVTFIGAGNMAMSLVRGLLQKDVAASDITLADPDPAQLARFDSLGVNTRDDNAQAIEHARVVVLAVKPQVAEQVVTRLPLRETQLLLSIAAGIPLSALAAWTHADQPLVRCMPNTPALLGAGMSALYASNTCTDQHRQFAGTVLEAGGDTLWVEREADLDAVTAVSGSGPAYFFLLMEAMIDAGQSLGLSREVATQLTLQTAFGASLMARDTDTAPADLRVNVTSPGGTTEAALNHFQAGGFGDLVSGALAAAHKRAAELGEEFGAQSDQERTS